MGIVQHGFHYAWEALLLDFEEVLLGSAATDPGARTGRLANPVFDRPFSIVKLFHHPFGEMGLELRADGYKVVLSMFREEPGSLDDSPEIWRRVDTEIGKVNVHYDELLDTPDVVMARILSFLPRG
jgi:hypothetical protein